MTLNNVAPPKPKRATKAPTPKKEPKPRATKSVLRDQEKDAKRKLLNAQAVVKRAEEKLAQVAAVKPVIENKAPAILHPDLIEEVSPRIKDELASRPVAFKPNDGPQTEFLAASEREVLYGGQAGGGKSYALLADPMRYFDNPNHNGIILRRTNDELRELIWKSKELYPKIFPGAKYNEQKGTWYLPKGGMHWMTFLDRDEDALRYQGQAFNWVGFDELTQWATPFAWEYMRSRLRSADTALDLCMRATANPGNRGGWWVRKMFLDPAPWGQAFWATDIESGKVLVYPDRDQNGNPHPKAGQPLFKRRFIPSSLKDNPYLTVTDDYQTNLLALPEVLRKQLAEGNWDVFEDSAFPEFNKAVHVIEPFDIPHNWYKFRAGDWGYSSPGCFLWFAVDPDGVLIVYREYYFKGKTADIVGAEATAMELGEQIKYGRLDSSVWAKRGDIGPTPVETMNRMGMRWSQADRSPGSRNAGKVEVHRRLAVDPEFGRPRLQIFSTCTNLIRTLPQLALDKNDPEDVDTKMEDHAYDALRYGCMSRPLPAALLYDRRAPTRLPYEVYDRTFGY